MEEKYTYISVSIMVYENEPEWNSGRIYLHDEAADIELHLDVPYKQAKEELDKLARRIGKQPKAVGEGDGSGSVMYILDALLE